MDLLYAASEMIPFVKVGGLADVAGALTKELARLGHGVRVFLPLYPSVRRFWSELSPEKVADLRVPMGSGDVAGVVYRAAVSGVDVELLLLENARFYDRPDPYVDPATGAAWPDGAESHAFFCRALLETCLAIGWTPDLIHLNDHQTALVAPMLREEYRAGPLGATAVLYSVHNLGYQGIFPAEGESQQSVRSLLQAMGFGEALFYPDGPLEFYGRINLMQVGLLYADLITTVSPTYAREIQSTELGFGLDEVLGKRADRVVGILNGIDSETWDPETDGLIPYKYSPSTFRNKARNKERLLEVAHLPAGPETPLVGMVSRLVDQKGLDLLVEVAEEFLGKHEVRMVVLGSGQPKYEDLMRELARRFPERFATSIGFDETLAHLITAGADFFLMPSRYEPCGLNQMYSLRYGTVPIARATGGLADTIEEFSATAERGNGFLFREYTGEALLGALERALAVYGSRPIFKRLARRIMGIDHSWARAAREYEAAYERAIRERQAELRGS
jgi:starch synthase